MSGHCHGCGTYHEEDDDRLCANCVADVIPATKRFPEPENSSEHIPTLYIGVSVHPCSQDRRWYLTTDAGLSPDDVREGARPRIFRLPSTADAERAKERERLSKERDDAAHAMWGNSLGSTASVRVPIDLWKAWMKATDALATFEATHGIGGGA